MNKKQLEIMNKKPGFIAALDQSGGSTPKALLAYGVDEKMYDGDAVPAVRMCGDWGAGG